MMMSRMMSDDIDDDDHDDDGPNRVKRTLISLKVMLSSCNAVCLYTCICIQKPLFAHRAA